MDTMGPLPSHLTAHVPLSAWNEGSMKSLVSGLRGLSEWEQLPRILVFRDTHFLAYSTAHTVDDNYFTSCFIKETLWALEGKATYVGFSGKELFELFLISFFLPNSTQPTSINSPSSLPLLPIFTTAPSPNCQHLLPALLQITPPVSVFPSPSLPMQLPERTWKGGSVTSLPFSEPSQHTWKTNEP